MVDEIGTQACGGFRRSANGFTLIELMVVVAVVAILAAIALPSYQDSVRKSRRAQAKADLVELAQLAERYRTVNRTYETWPLAFDTSPRTGTAHYRIDLDDEGAATFTLTAVPNGAQANDACGTLVINQAGQRWHSTGTDEQCQFGSQGTPSAPPAGP